MVHRVPSQLKIRAVARGKSLHARKIFKVLHGSARAGARVPVGCGVAPADGPGLLQAARSPAPAGAPERDRAARPQKGATAQAEARDGVAHPVGVARVRETLRRSPQNPLASSHGETQG